MMGPWCNRLGWGRMGGWPGVGLLGPLFGGILLLAMIALLIIGALWFARRPSGSRATALQVPEDPLEIAQHRLAAGDITTAEFEEIRVRLSGER